MNFDQQQPIVAQMQPVFDALPEKLKEEKNRRGLTNQQLSDISGVPIATTSRILAGAVSNPGIFHVSALCAAMGVSLDALMGMAVPLDDCTAELTQLRQEVAHKSEMLEEKEKAIARLLDRSRMQEAGIAARDAQIQNQEEDLRRRSEEAQAIRKAYKPLIYGLCGLCILLTVVWGIYVVLDARRPDVGLIRSDTVSPLIWIGAAAVVIILIMLLHFTVSRWYQKVR